jgi:hypothetical protein
LTRPIPLPNALGVSDDVAYVISHWLTAGLREARRNAERIHPDVVETVDKIELRGAAWRNERRPAVPRSDKVYTARRDWVRSREAATALSVTPRRVLALIAAGQLDAEKQLGDPSWRISPSSIAARKVHMYTLNRQVEP